MLTEDQIRTDEQLELDGLNPDDVELFHKFRSMYVELADKLQKFNDEKDFASFVDLEPVVNDLEFKVLYFGKNPKEIPKAALLDNLRNAEHQRVTNPASGVRAFCLFCMGGQAVEVRQCPAMTCPLWAFRLGKNPLFGRKLPEVEDVVNPDIDDDVTVEEDDNEDVSDDNG